MNKLTNLLLLIVLALAFSSTALAGAVETPGLTSTGDIGMPGVASAGGIEMPGLTEAIMLALDGIIYGG